MSEDLVPNTELNTVPNTEDLVPKSELEKVQHQLVSMAGRWKAGEDRVSDLTSQIAKLQNINDNVKVGTDENLSLRSQVTELQEMAKQHKARDERLRMSAKRQVLVKELTAKGGDQTLSELAADSILATSGSKITAIETDSGSYSINYEDISGMIIPIGDFVNQYMESDIGKKIVPSKANPQIGGELRPAVHGDIIKVTKLQANKLTDEQLSTPGLVDLLPG